MPDPFPDGVDCAECPWRDYLEAAPPNDVTQAAAEILALINARPQTPRAAEIEAIIAKVVASPPVVPALSAEQQPDQPQGMIAVHRDHWRQLLDDWLAKVAISGCMRGDAPGEKEATAASDAALEAIQELEDDLCALRATSWPDVVMLSDILLRNKFDLFDRPNTNGLYDADFEATLERGAVCQGEAVDDVIAALLRGIRDVTLAQAGFGPWRRLDQHRMIRDLAPPERGGNHSASRDTGRLATDLRAAMVRESELSVTMDVPDGPAYDEARAAYEANWQHLRALVAQIPSPPRTFADIALRAEVAFHCSGGGSDGTMSELDAKDIFLWSAAHLVQSVLQFKP